MKKWFVGFFFLFNGCDGDGSLGTTDSLGPTVSSYSIASAATSVALQASVTATMSEAIKSDTVTTTNVTLTAAGSSTNSCTSVSYDATTNIITCTHDVLSGSTVYTLTIKTGVQDTVGNGVASDLTNSFTTIAASSVSNFSRTSATLNVATGDSTTLTYAFSSAVPVGLTPTIAVVDANNTSKTVSGCTFNADRTQYNSCVVANIAGCQTPMQYTATLSGAGFTTHTVSFNSWDDEFDNYATTRANCYHSIFNNATNNTTNGTLAVSVVANASPDSADKTVVNLTQGFGVAVKITAESGVRNTTSADCDDDGESAMIGVGPVSSAPANDYNLFTGTFFAGGTLYDTLINTATGGTASSAVLSPTGSLSSTINAGPPYYLCTVFFRNSTIRSYISVNGTTYSQLTTSALNVADDPLGLGLAGIATRDASSWSTTINGFRVYMNNTCNGTATTYVATVDYLRMNSNIGTTPSVADCPRF